MANVPNEQRGQFLHIWQRRPSAPPPPPRCEQARLLDCTFVCRWYEAHARPQALPTGSSVPGQPVLIRSWYFFFLSTSRARFLMTCNGIFFPLASLVAISYQTRMCFHNWQTVLRIWKALLSTEIVDLITSQSKVKVTLTFPLSSSCKQRLRNGLRSSLDYGSKVNLELRINPFDLCWPKDRATLTYWFYMQIMTRMKSLTQAVKTVAFFHIFFSRPLSAVQMPTKIWRCNIPQQGFLIII